MPEILIRRLERADVPALIEVRLLALQESPDAFGASYEEYAARGPQGNADWAHDRLDTGVWGAFLGDRLVGMVGLKPETSLKSRHHATIWGTYVAPEGRGLGLGRGLMQAAIAHARTLPGVDWVQLGVGAGQTAAHGLYQALGFEAWGRQPAALRVNGRDLDEIFMALKLG
ncbi:MAG TPA: GNAT family N-acetyltransferase [Oscillatoriaceae cyanobacterium]